MGLLKSQAKIFLVLALAVVGVLLYSFSSTPPESQGSQDGFELWTITLSASEDGESSFNYTELPENRIGILRIVKGSDGSEVTDFQNETTWVYCGICNLSESSYTIYYQTPLPTPTPSPSETPTPSPEPSPSPSPESSPTATPEPTPTSTPTPEPTPVPTSSLQPSGCTPLYQSVKLSSDAVFNSEGGVCFDIRQSGVELDCDGHSIIGNEKGFAVYGTKVGSVTVKNCRIENFGYGILFNGYISGGPVFENIIVENNSVSNTRTAGIGVKGAFSRVSFKNNVVSGSERCVWIDGLNGYETYETEASSNTLSDCETGVLLEAISNARVSGNTIGASKTGVWLTSAAKNAVTQNKVSSAQTAFWIENYDSNDNTFSENTVSAIVGFRRYPNTRNEIGNNALSVQTAEQEFEETTEGQEGSGE